WPSMMSRCSQSAPEAPTRSASLASLPKLAASSDGAMITRVYATEQAAKSRMGICAWHAAISSMWDSQWWLMGCTNLCCTCNTGFVDQETALIDLVFTETSACGLDECLLHVHETFVRGHALRLIYRSAKCTVA